MTAFSILRAGTAALALISCGSIVRAQYMPAPTPTADALAAQMRVLGSDPRNVYALIAAGELSTRLGDPAAALGFFGRAQAIEPGNMKVAAGKASALVLLERPGEALRLFDQAERAGVAMEPYLQQRGLAYDLTGQPGYAQRDYRRSLKIAPDDETTRRLALSLGISGRRDEAMNLLDPLLRRSDRAAWRARACIMAIGGDAGGAQRIATSMIPGGAGLSPFFSRLQWLSPADRAFAVHFGEVKANAARLNDARLAPALAALPDEPAPLPSVASARVAERPASKPDRSRRKLRPGREPIVVATAQPAPTPASDAPPPAPPSAGTMLAMRSPTPTPFEPFAPAPEPPRQTAEPVAMAVERGTALPDAVQSTVTPKPTPAPVPANGRASAIGWAATADTPQPLAGGATAAASVPARVEPVVIDVPRPPPREPTVVVSSPPPAPPPAAAASAPAPKPKPKPAAAAAPERTPAVARRNTDLLASIVGSITVPASELEVAPATPLRPAAAVKTPVAKKVEPKASEAKKPEPKKSDPKKPEPGKAEPARWWAQVAGGANAADLGKDWKRLTAKSPAAFRGKSAWTTPLRATNRLLAGPFKSQGEAMAFVNTLAKDGTSAFAWQSEAGQIIARLATR